MFDVKGKTIIAEFYGCDSQQINNLAFIRDLGIKAIENADMHIEGLVKKKFNPQGLSIAFLLSESHLCVHSSPEHNYLTIDVFTCGSGSPEKAIEIFEKELTWSNKKSKTLLMGYEINNLSMTKEENYII